jgi:hypothetical protein
MSRIKLSWIANKRSGKGKKEFHRVVEAGFSQPQGCQFSEIVEKNKVKFRTQREAREAGYDACAYCTKRLKSRR